jgi:hypothetical protein
MSSEVEICSDALLLLGEEPITSFDDASKKARLCKRFYPVIRDSVLRAYPWRCAIKYQSLNILTGDSAITESDYAYTYQLPASPYCLRALLINNDKTVQWEVIGRKLVTDEESVTLKYIARITDPGDFDALLVMAIAIQLAQAIAYPITGNPQFTKIMEDLYQLRMLEARSIDSMEGSVEEMSSDDLLEVR